MNEAEARKKGGLGRRCFKHLFEVYFSLFYSALISNKFNYFLQDEIVLPVMVISE